MKNIINLVVEEELYGKRIDVIIAKKNNSLSRTRIKNLIVNGNLSINNKIVNDPSKKIYKDDKVFLTIPLPKKASLKPFKYKLDIIYNDEDLLVRIKLKLKKDGTILNSEILDHQRMNRPGQKFYKVLAESALRAVRLCQPLKVPPTGYDKWKDIQLNFNPAEMLKG